MCNYRLLLIFLVLFPSLGWGQDLSIGISYKLYNKVLESLIHNELISQKLKLKIDSVPFSIKNVVLQRPEMTEDNDFLKVYGKHLLFMDFQKPFEIDVELMDMAAELEFSNVDVKLGKSRIAGKKTKIPLSVFVNMKNADVLIGKSKIVEKGLTSDNGKFLKELETDLNRLKKQVKEGRRDDQLNKQIFERYTLLECLKKDQEKKEQIEFNAENHTVGLKEIKVELKGEIELELKGDNAALELSRLSITDNLTPDNFASMINIELEGKQFQANDITIVTYKMNESDELEANCHQLEGSSSGLQTELFDNVIIPKVKENIASKIDELLEVKLYPKLTRKLESKSFPLRTKLESTISKTDIFKKDKKNSQKKIDIISMIQEQFNSIITSLELKSLSIDKVGTIKASSDINLKIDNENVNCDDRDHVSCKYFSSEVILPTDSENDFNIALNGKFITGVINRLDDSLVSEIAKTIPLLLDQEGNPVLSLDNHDLLIIPVGENTLDIVFKFNIETFRLKKILKFFMASDYQIETRFQKVRKNVCKYLLKKSPGTLYLFPLCHNLIKDEPQSLSFATDLRVVLKKDPKTGQFVLDIKLPQAKDLFNSKYVETNWDDYYLLRMAYSLLNEKKWEVNLGKLLGIVKIYHYPGLYQKVLKKAFRDKYYDLVIKDGSYHWLHSFSLNEKTNFQLGKIEWDKNGHFFFGVDVKDPKKIGDKIKLKGEK